MEPPISHILHPNIKRRKEVNIFSSQVIVKWTETLRCTQPLFEPEPQSLNPCSILHKLGERRRIGTRHLDKLGISDWRGDIRPDTPKTTLFLEILAEQKVVKKLGAFGVWCVLEDSGCLRPRDELALLGESGIERSLELREAKARGKRRDVGCVGISDKVWACGRTTNPSWFLLQQLVEPGGAVLFEAIQ